MACWAWPPPSGSASTLCSSTLPAIAAENAEDIVDVMSDSQTPQIARVEEYIRIVDDSNPCSNANDEQAGGAHDSEATGDGANVGLYYLSSTRAAWLMDNRPSDSEALNDWMQCQVGELLLPGKAGSSGDPHPVRRRCWFSVADGQWLNSTAVNAQILHTRKRHEVSLEQEGILVVTCCFLSLLEFEVGKKKGAATRWFNSRELVADLCLDRLNRVVIPTTIGENTHYVVFVVSWVASQGNIGDAWEIAVYDSLTREEHRDELNKWAAFIGNELIPLVVKKGAGKGIKSETCRRKVSAPFKYTGTVQNYPQQRNSYDCGPAALCAIDCLAAGVPVSWVPSAAASHRENIRTNMVLNGHIGSPVDGEPLRRAKKPRTRRDQKKIILPVQDGKIHSIRQQRGKVLFGSVHFDLDEILQSPGEPELSDKIRRQHSFIRRLSDFGRARAKERKLQAGASSTEDPTTDPMSGDLEQKIAAGILMFKEWGDATKQAHMACINGYVAWYLRGREAGKQCTWIVTKANAQVFLSVYCARIMGDGNIPNPEGELDKNKAALGALVKLQSFFDPAGYDKEGGNDIFKSAEHNAAPLRRQLTEQRSALTSTRLCDYHRGSWGQNNGYSRPLICKMLRIAMDEVCHATTHEKMLKQLEVLCMYLEQFMTVGRGQLMRGQTRGGRGLYSGAESGIEEVVQIIVAVTKDRDRHETYLIRARDVRDCPIAHMNLLCFILHQIMDKPIYWTGNWKDENVYCNITAAAHGEIFKDLQMKAGIILYTPGPDGRATVTHHGRKQAVVHSQKTGGNMDSARIMGWSTGDKMTQRYRNEPEFQQILHQSGWQQGDPYYLARGHLDPLKAGFGDLYGDPDFLQKFAASVSEAQSLLPETPDFDIKHNILEAASRRKWILQDLPLLMAAYPNLKTYLEAKSPFFASERFAEWSKYALNEATRLEEAFAADYVAVNTPMIEPFKHELRQIHSSLHSIEQHARENSKYLADNSEKASSSGGDTFDNSVRIACVQQDLEVIGQRMGNLEEKMDEVLVMLKRQDMQESSNQMSAPSATYASGANASLPETNIAGMKRKHGAESVSSKVPEPRIMLASIENVSSALIWHSFKSEEAGGLGWHKMSYKMFDSRTRYYQYQEVARLVAAVIHNTEKRYEKAGIDIVAAEILAKAIAVADSVKGNKRVNVSITDSMPKVKAALELQELEVGEGRQALMAPPFLRKPRKAECSRKFGKKAQTNASAIEAI